MNRILRHFIQLLLALFFWSCTEEGNKVAQSVLPPDELDLNLSYYVHVQVGSAKDDEFTVNFFAKGLQEDAFHLPSVIPGTYSYSDFGRFVRSFSAFDEDDTEIETSQIQTNQWQIESPKSAYRIRYKIRETWDTVVIQNPIFRAAGTSIENDHALLNLPAIIGYPEAQKDREFIIDFDFPKGWKLATSLEKYDDDTYYAANFDQLADSPVLVGNLSQSFVNVEDTEIGISVYASKGNFTSEILENDIQSVIRDANVFLNGLPVDQYQFLFHFDNLNVGALEHQKSSVYALQDGPYTTEYAKLIRNISAHEFFHIVTPLNIHSEVISNYNFDEPQPTQHLWFYEGVTEWASRMMQLNNNSISAAELLDQFSEKIQVSETYFDNSYPLSKMSINSYTREGNAQFVNVYYKGAMVAFLLDIRLLELSNGTYGLQNLIMDLIENYGPGQDFPESDFFGILVDLTYPELEEFFDLYIVNAEPLPFKSYGEKIGIGYSSATYTLKESFSKSPDQTKLFQSWKSVDR